MIARSWERVSRLIPRTAIWNGFWWVAGIGMVLVGGAFLPWRFWEELHDDQDSLSTTIRNLALVVGGIIAMLLAVWRSLVAESQAYTARQGLLNERYRQAIEMLGSTVLSVRLGGIYALQHLAEEHPREYHVQVERILCAFVRHPAIYDDAKAEDDTGKAAASASARGHVHGRPRLREDVQAIMTVIGNRGESSIALERNANFVIDLNGADLSYAQLAGANLSIADLSFTNLHRADFSGRQLPPSNPLSLGHPNNRLRDPASSNCIRFSANLSGANLSYANLSKAWMMAVDLSGARLVEADLSWTRLFFAKLSKANLFEANLSNASIEGADLADAHLAGGNLSEATLTGATLRGANFSRACLRLASLSSAVLSAHGGSHPATGLTQNQLDDSQPIIPGNYPSLAGVVDAKTGQPLVWRQSRNDGE